MASFLKNLQETNAKKGLFTSTEISVSYPLGFPILDQLLGGVYIREDANGNKYKDIHIGVPAGTFTIFSGQTASGKTTAAVQAAANIVEPFGDKGVIIHRDGERSTNYDRVQTLTGWTKEQIEESYVIERDNNTWENVLTEIVTVAEQKQAAGEDMMYNTGQYDIWGNEYKYYVPTVFIIDSLMKFMSEKEATDMINGLTSGSRGAIYAGVFFRNALEYMGKYNINVFVINHIDDAMPDMRGMTKPKQMTYMPTGKYMPGGHKTKLLTSSIIYFKPKTTKDDIRTEEENGWNGVPTEAYIIKSRTSKGGFSTILEFIQESGFDTRLTLMRFAKDKGLIKGRNPACYFEEMPDVKFDTRRFLDEITENPDILMALFKACKKPLMDLIPVVDISNDGDKVRNAKSKIMSKELMRKYFTASDEDGE
jgi:RecA/RadA recombinase